MEVHFKMVNLSRMPPESTPYTTFDNISPTLSQSPFEVGTESSQLILFRYHFKVESKKNMNTSCAVQKPKEEQQNAFCMQLFAVFSKVDDIRSL